jgi:hypothetical protein
MPQALSGLGPGNLSMAKALESPKNGDFIADL